MHHSPLWFDIISMAFHFKINMFYIFQLNDKWGLHQNNRFDITPFILKPFAQGLFCIASISYPDG